MTPPVPAREPQEIWAIVGPSGCVLDTALYQRHAEQLAREHGAMLGKPCTYCRYVPEPALQTVPALEVCFADRARRFALEKSAELDIEARRIGILRSVDATEAARWLADLAQAIREACAPAEPEQP